MAGDWLKIEKDTARKPEVLAIAKSLGINRQEAFTLCFEFWSWADSSSTDGVIVDVTVDELDALFHCSGFSDALRKVDWLEVRSGSLLVPHFDRHMGQSAKRRALNAKRSAKVRKRKAALQALLTLLFSLLLSGMEKSY